jgi:hypothetical protein
MDKLARYKVLAGALALDVFTVADLARFCQVKPATIRTVLKRDRDLVDSIGREHSAKRGGQPVRYRVREGSRTRLSSELRQLELVSPSHPPGEHGIQELLAAQDILIDQVPRARTWQERRNLLAIATADYQAVRHATHRAVDGPHAHLRAIDFLIRFSHAEDVLFEPKPFTAESPPTGMVRAAKSDMGPALEKMRTDLIDLLYCDLPANNRDLIPSLLKRVYGSRLASALGQLKDSSHTVSLPWGILLVDTIQKMDHDDLNTFVTKALRSSRIPFQPTAMPTPNNEPEAWTNRVVQDFNASAYCVTVSQDTTIWQPMIQEFYKHFGSLRNFVFISEINTPMIYNKVLAREGRYLSLEGLEPDGLVGAIGAAMDAGPPVVNRVFEPGRPFSRSVGESDSTSTSESWALNLPSTAEHA